MSYKTHNSQNIRIFFRGEVPDMDNPELLFDAHRPSADCPESKRGKAQFVTYKGMQLVLKHYYRGGLVGRLVHDVYLNLPGCTPRMLAEFQLLRELRAQHLPVPAPVAARCIYLGPLSLCYRGDLVTERIPESVTLYEYLGRRALNTAQWRCVGEVIARFHAANVYHADLNATNILLDANQQPWLIDFDKSRIRKHSRWKFSNLARLKRSLAKLQRNTPDMHFHENDWQALLEGYNRPPTLQHLDDNGF